MVLENIEGSVELPHVEYVDIVVLACCRNIEGFHGVPAKRIGGKVKERLPQRGIRSEIVKHDTPITGGGRQETRLDLVEGYLVDRVHIVRPGKGLGSRTLAFEIVYADV